MPGVDLCLQLISSTQERRVAWRESADQRGKSAPKLARLHAAARDGFIIDKIVQSLVDLELFHANGRSHRWNSYLGCPPMLRALQRQINGKPQLGNEANSNLIEATNLSA
jgi:hypothetical protein